MKTKNTEQATIQQVAKRYEGKGYRVVIEPRGLDIPSFVKNYQPDLIATSDNDNVVVEVKSRSQLSAIPGLRDVADVINKTEHWRFELIVVYSERENDSNSVELNIDYDTTEIARSLQEVKGMDRSEHYAAAFILCWANMESLSRQLLLEDKRDLSNKMPLVLVKTLFSYGYLTRMDYEELEKLSRVRNQVVHGYKSDELDKRAIDRLVSITEKLLIEKESLDKQKK